MTKQRNASYQKEKKYVKKMFEDVREWQPTACRHYLPSPVSNSHTSSDFILNSRFPRGGSICSMSLWSPTMYCTVSVTMSVSLM